MSTVYSERLSPDTTLDLAAVVRVAAAHADQVDLEGRFPVEAIAALRASGLLGCMLPHDLGGRGASLLDIARQCQQIARGCASTAMIYAMHQSQVACIVGHALTQPWHRALARRIAEEGLLLGSVTSEVGVGGDMGSSRCAMVVADGRFTLEKHAPTVSYGAYADVLLVTCRAHADAPPSDQALVTLLRSDCDLTPTGGWDALGMRGTCSGAFRLSATGRADQIVPAAFAEISENSMVPVSHLLWGAAWTGIAAEAVTRARAFLRAQARRQIGTMPPGAVRLVHAVASLDTIQAALSRALTQFDVAHPLGRARFARHAAIDGAAGAWPTGMARASLLNALKIEISTQCHDVVMEALRICGMSGYKNGGEFSVGRHLRDILSAQIMISNDRIATTTGALLLAQRHDLGTL
ncbi:acyl-CoA dehydrogenase family protein [Robbsia andropogonis]|uniref:acyl-CoA dehydrogenase family protein n=1 Tax=Robbsia andropogonis TaxID=28092 RepID=UPI0020A1EDE9|nr:acyl-CoA/acyl-ACP dehydrogenase [Robbsia andropogonis]MCP1128046.1 acyl-CoA/acyl-ACP dehydrogenase [Robbsia andropogonis]